MYESKKIFFKFLFIFSLASSLLYGDGIATASPKFNTLDRIRWLPFMDELITKCTGYSKKNIHKLELTKIVEDDRSDYAYFDFHAYNPHNGLLFGSDVSFILRIEIYSNGIAPTEIYNDTTNIYWRNCNR